MCPPSLYTPCCNSRPCFLPACRFCPAAAPASLHWLPCWRCPTACKLHPPTPTPTPPLRPTRSPPPLAPALPQLYHLVPGPPAAVNQLNDAQVFVTALGGSPAKTITVSETR